MNMPKWNSPTDPKIIPSPQFLRPAPKRNLGEMYGISSFPPPSGFSMGETKCLLPIASCPNCSWTKSISETLAHHGASGDRESEEPSKTKELPWPLCYGLSFHPKAQKKSSLIGLEMEKKTCWNHQATDGFLLCGMKNARVTLSGARMVIHDYLLVSFYCSIFGSYYNNRWFSTVQECSG